jgi:DNA-binding PadR family transcriptional regulator
VSTNLTDLVVLSIVARKNVTYTDIISVIKDIAGEYWSPTGDVLCEAIEDLINKRFLEIQHSALNRECLQITKTGLEEFSSLLLQLPDRDTEIRYSRLLELVQLRSLDLVPGTVAGTIISQMLQRANSLIKKLEQRERVPGPEGRFMGVWLSAEKQDLNNRANILSEIARTNLLSTKICCEDGRPCQ